MPPITWNKSGQLTWVEFTSLPSFSSVTLLGSEDIARKVKVFFSPSSATISTKHETINVINQ